MEASLIWNILTTNGKHCLVLHFFTQFLSYNSYFQSEMKYVWKYYFFISGNLKFENVRNIGNYRFKFSNFELWSFDFAFFWNYATLKSWKVEDVDWETINFDLTIPKSSDVSVISIKIHEMEICQIEPTSLFSSKGIPSTPQHTDSHPCKTQWNPIDTGLDKNAFGSNGISFRNNKCRWEHSRNMIKCCKGPI